MIRLMSLKRGWSSRKMKGWMMGIIIARSCIARRRRAWRMMWMIGFVKMRRLRGKKMRRISFRRILRCCSRER